MENSAVQRLTKFLKNNRIKQIDFAKNIGIAKSTVSDIISGRRALSQGMLARIYQAYPNLNPAWVESGLGDPELKRDDLNNAHPMLEDTAAAGFNVGMPLNDLSSNALPQIPLVPDFDFYIKVSGRSMEPVLLDGDILACRIVSDRANIPYGHICVVCSNDAFLVKYLLPSSDNSDSSDSSENSDSSDYPDSDSETIILHSANPDYPDIILPCTEVFRIALVVGLIRPSIPALSSIR